MSSGQRNQIIEEASKYVGVVGGSTQHKYLVDTYNAQVPDSMKVSYTDAWCAVFASAIYILTGLQSKIPIDCYCPSLVSRSKEMGIWKSGTGAIGESYTPQPADLILFQWDGQTECHHVGIVEYIDDTYIHTIEGNCGNTCKKVDRVRGDSHIKGFTTPDLDGGYDPPTPPVVDYGTLSDHVIYDKMMYCLADNTSSTCTVQYDGQLRNYLLDSDDFDILSIQENGWSQIKVTDWTTWTPWVMLGDVNTT